MRARETKGVEWLRGCWLLLLGDEEGAGGGGGGGGGSGGVKRGSRGVRALAGRYFCACLVFNFSPPLALFFLALSPSSREQQRKLTLSPRHARGGRAEGDRKRERAGIYKERKAYERARAAVVLVRMHISVASTY